ncbi:MAG: hypothetical protein AAB614_03385 [Patescibacteria group bacterium]
MAMKSKVAEEKKPILRLLYANETIAIKPCDGKETLAKADDVFGVIDQNFKNLDIDNKAEDATDATKKVSVQIYEVAKETTPAEMFGFLGGNLERLCMTQHQIKLFCRDNFNTLHFNTFDKDERISNFFLFQNGEYFFIPSVSRHYSGLSIVLHKFRNSFAMAILPPSRLVVPELKANL